jgi:hypothetical protein
LVVFWGKLQITHGIEPQCTKRMLMSYVQWCLSAAIVLVLDSTGGYLDFCVGTGVQQSSKDGFAALRSSEM